MKFHNYNHEPDQTEDISNTADCPSPPPTHKPYPCREGNYHPDF